MDELVKRFKPARRQRRRMGRKHEHGQENQDPKAGLREWSLMALVIC